MLARAGIANDENASVEINVRRQNIGPMAGDRERPECKISNDVSLLQQGYSKVGMGGQTRGQRFPKREIWYKDISR